MTAARTLPNGLALAAFIVSVCSLVPTIAVTVIGLLVTNATAASLREHPGAVSMISSDFGEWAPLIWGSVAFGVPAAATALGLGIASLRKPGRRVFAVIAIAISAAVIVLAVIGTIANASQGRI